MNDFEVTEVCPYCNEEITMIWNVQSDGYKAFCPVCGKTLMLCDECMHSEDGEHKCDYDKRTGTCKHNPLIPAKSIRIKNEEGRMKMENTKSLYPSQDKEIRKYELECGFITYATLSRYVGDMILANTYVENTQTFAPYSGTDEKEDGTPKEFFQYYIISEQGAEFLAEYAPDEVVYYDEDYDLYVWCIDHFGTAWSGVLTNVRAKEC